MHAQLTCNHQPTHYPCHSSEVPKSCTLELSEDPDPKKSIEIPILSDKDTTHVVAATELPTTAKTKGDLSGHGDPESRELDCAVTSTVSLPKEAELSPKVKSALASVPPTGVKRKRSLPPWLSEVKIESKPPPAKKHKAPPVAGKKVQDLYYFLIQISGYSNTY